MAGRQLQAGQYTGRHSQPLCCRQASCVHWITQRSLRETCHWAWPRVKVGKDGSQSKRYEELLGNGSTLRGSVRGSSYSLSNCRLLNWSPSRFQPFLAPFLSLTDQSALLCWIFKQVTSLPLPSEELRDNLFKANAHVSPGKIAWKTHIIFLR